MHAFRPSTPEAEGGECYEFEDSLVYSEFQVSQNYIVLPYVCFCECRCTRVYHRIHVDIRGRFWD